MVLETFRGAFSTESSSDEDKLGRICWGCVRHGRGILFVGADKGSGRGGKWFSTRRLIDDQVVQAGLINSRRINE